MTQTVYLVEEQANPSTDFFVLPALSAQNLSIIRCQFNDLPTAAELQNAFVVFVRYVPSQWATLISATRAQLAGVVLFIDDDVLDFSAAVGLPWAYRFKLARLITRRRHWLRQQNVQLWVSTPYLQQKYADWRPRLISPMPIANKPYCHVFYHGSASHHAEIAWLLPVMREVLTRNETIAFEIIGNQAVQRLYRGLPRVSVVHQLKWAAYQAFLSGQTRHIGLAPLLNVPFNAARSYTKFFDISQCGAVGIYSTPSACAAVLEHNRDGLILELNQSAWIEAILTLANNEPLRQQLLANAQSTLTALKNQAQQAQLL